MAAGGVFCLCDPPILCKLRKLIIIRIPPNECNKSSISNQLPLDCLRLVSSGSLEALLFAMSHMAFFIRKN